MDAESNATAPSSLAVPDPRLADVNPAGHRRKWLLSVRFDPDVIEWFRTQGPRYQTRMNAVLRAYMQHTGGDRDRS